MSTRLSTESKDKRWPQRADAVKKGPASHRNEDNVRPMHRASRAGTRYVSKLSADQLARKHTHDREAQRAFRQRTKKHIENLERQVEETQRRNRALENEIGRLKERMGRSRNKMQPSINGLGMPMGLGQNIAADMANIQLPMDINYNSADGIDQWV